jgi:hypothetical protein
LELDGESNRDALSDRSSPTGFTTSRRLARIEATNIVATVTHADGRHLEHFEVDRAA